MPLSRRFPTMDRLVDRERVTGEIPNAGPPRSLWRDASASAMAAGFVTVLVGVASSAAIVFQAAHALGATQAQTASWIWALGMALGLTCIGLSLRYRMPVVTAWSTPGAAMLVVSATGNTLAEATGAFLVCAVLIAIAGFSGGFERIIERIPVSLASGMLAGVLLPFGLDVFRSLRTQPALVLCMLVVYVAARRLAPRYAVIFTLLAGVGAAAAGGLLQDGGFALQLTRPVWVTPAFSVASIIGIAIPLFVVTMASQNVPGVAVTRASGYPVPISPTIGWTGVANLVMAPFGAFAVNLAAITAAICMGREAHEDPARRYVAAISAGGFYLLTGLFGATVVALFAALPRELIVSIAGLALLGTIGNGLAAAVRDEAEREPAIITFLITASGISLLGIGSAFWGVVGGVLALLALRWRTTRT
jgi:benzoate membrane transport protein